MKLEPVPLVAPASERRVSPCASWSLLTATLLAGAALGFATATDGLPASAIDEPSTPSQQSLRGWLEVRAGLEAEELLPDAIAYLDAVVELGDARFLPAIERLAYALLEGQPGLKSERVTLAAAIVAHLPKLPPSSELARLRAALENLR